MLKPEARSCGCEAGPCTAVAAGCRHGTNARGDRAFEGLSLRRVHPGNPVNLPLRLGAPARLRSLLCLIALWGSPHGVVAAALEYPNMAIHEGANQFRAEPKVVSVIYAPGQTQVYGPWEPIEQLSQAQIELWSHGAPATAYQVQIQAISTLFVSIEDKTIPLDDWKQGDTGWLPLTPLSNGRYALPEMVESWKLPFPEYSQAEFEVQLQAQLEVIFGENAAEAYAHSRDSLVIHVNASTVRLRIAPLGETDPARFFTLEFHPPNGC